MRPPEVLELLRHGTWEKEPVGEQEELIAWVQSQKQIAEVFQAAGIKQAGDVVDAASLPEYHEVRYYIQEQIQAGAHTLIPPTEAPITTSLSPGVSSYMKMNEVDVDVQVGKEEFRLTNAG